MNMIQTLKIRGKKTEKENDVQLVMMDDFISCMNSGGEEGVEHCPSRASVAKLCKLQVVRRPPRCGSLSFFTVIILPHGIVPHECLLFLAFTFVSSDRSSYSDSVLLLVRARQGNFFRF